MGLGVSVGVAVGVFVGVRVGVSVAVGVKVVVKVGLAFATFTWASESGSVFSMANENIGALIQARVPTARQRITRAQGSSEARGRTKACSVMGVTSMERCRE